MKIAVHAQVLTAPRLFGIGYYLYHLLNALGKDTSSSFCLFSGRSLQHTPTGGNLTCVPKQKCIPSKCFSYLGFPIGAKALNCNAAFVPKETTPFGLSMPTVITAYDLFPYKMPDELRAEFPRMAAVHFRLAKWLHFKRAAKILAISQDTKNDLIEICKIPEERIVVTPLGVDPLFSQSLPNDHVQAVLRKFDIRSPFFINTSSHWWGRKNLVRLIRSFARAKKQGNLPHQLVIVGLPGPSQRKMLETIHQENVVNDVKLLNYLSREESVALVQSADAMIFPSLHEGFGLPIIEAMASGCPVITSNVSAMPEVAGDAALLIDPFDEEAIAEAITTIAHDDQLKKQLIEKGKERSRLFTWERTAQHTLEAFKNL